MKMAVNRMYAVGRMKAGKKNRTEEEYEETVLKPMLQAGEILWYKFEAMTLKLADDTRYTPDFDVINRAGELEFHEIKGFWKDDAKVKFKVAAELFPFKFKALAKQPKKVGGGFKIIDER